MPESFRPFSINEGSSDDLKRWTRRSSSLPVFSPKGFLDLRRKSILIEEYRFKKILSIENSGSEGGLLPPFRKNGAIEKTPYWELFKSVTI
jgi:hypothetical protein